MKKRERGEKDRLKEIGVKDKDSKIEEVGKDNEKNRGERKGR